MQKVLAASVSMNNLPVNMSLNKTFVSLHLRLEKCKPKREKYNDLDIREKAYGIPSSSHNTVILNMSIQQLNL